MEQLAIALQSVLHVDRAHTDALGSINIMESFAGSSMHRYHVCVMQGGSEPEALGNDLMIISFVHSRHILLYIQCEYSCVGARLHSYEIGLLLKGSTCTERI